VPHRVSQFRLMLVKDGPAISTTWDRQVREPQDVARFMAPLAANLDREMFWVLMLDARNKVTGLHVVSVGSLTSTIVHPREVWKAAILANAASVILCHNHPSGEPTPSTEDLALTARLLAVGELVGIRLLDHVVLGADGSFRSLAASELLRGAA